MQRRVVPADIPLAFTFEIDPQISRIFSKYQEHQFTNSFCVTFTVVLLCCSFHLRQRHDTMNIFSTNSTSFNSSWVKELCWHALVSTTIFNKKVCWNISLEMQHLQENLHLYIFFDLKRENVLSMRPLESTASAFSGRVLHYLLFHICW